MYHTRRLALQNCYSFQTEGFTIADHRGYILDIMHCCQLGIQPAICINSMLGSNQRLCGTVCGWRRCSLVPSNVDLRLRGNTRRRAAVLCLLPLHLRRWCRIGAEALQEVLLTILCCCRPRCSFGIGAIGGLLPTTYYLLPTTYYLLPTTYYLLPNTYYLLPTTHYCTYYLLPTTYYLLPTTYYLLPTTYYLLPTTI